MLFPFPAFLFVGCFMNEVGLTDRIFTMAEKWIGHLTGGLAHANILASMVFAGMSGSALAEQISQSGGDYCMLKPCRAQAVIERTRRPTAAPSRRMLPHR